MRHLSGKVSQKSALVALLPVMCTLKCSWHISSTRNDNDEKIWVLYLICRYYMIYSVHNSCHGLSPVRSCKRPAKITEKTAFWSPNLSELNRKKMKSIWAIKRWQHILHQRSYPKQCQNWTERTDEKIGPCHMWPYIYGFIMVYHYPPLVCRLGGTSV